MEERNIDNKEKAELIRKYNDMLTEQSILRKKLKQLKNEILTIK